MRQSKSKLKILTLVLISISLVLGACQFKPPKLTPAVPSPSGQSPLPSQVATRLAEHATPTPIPSATPWPVASDTPQPEPRQNTLGFVNPLTGLTVNRPSLLRERPVLVKIANWPESLRPADGLNKADMVFEYFIGAQSNHLLALYYGDDHEHVGPLGPGRVVDARIAEHMQGQLIVASADDIVGDVLESYLNRRYTMRGFAPCPAICTETLAQGGNTFVNTDAVRNELAKKSDENFIPSLFGLKFSKTAPESSDDAFRFSFMYADFSVMDWRFNEDSGAYELWQDKKVSAGEYTLSKSEDLGSGEPIAFENIIFLFSNYFNYRNLFFDINFKDGGTEQRGILLRDGKLYHIRWGAEGFDQPFHFYDLEGEPFLLKPGKTWVTLATMDSNIEQVDEGEWDMRFILK